MKRREFRRHWVGMARIINASLVVLVCLQPRLTLEKLEPYHTHFKQKVCAIQGQTVSHLSTVSAKFTIGGIFARRSESREKIRPQRSKHKIALLIWRLRFLTAWLVR